MELNDCVLMTRNILRNDGLGYFNLIIFGVPEPLGFRFRNSIGLSRQFVEMHDADSIENTVRHECCHAWVDDDAPIHGTKFQLEARWQGVKLGDERYFDPEFDRINAAYRNNPELRAAGEKFLNEIVQTLDEWANQGLRGITDLQTFAYPRLNTSVAPKSEQASSTTVAPQKAATYQHRAGNCRGDCQLIGYHINHGTGIVHPLVKGSGETRGEWHTACSRCARDHFARLPKSTQHQFSI